jgi:hypothetical protein
MQQPPQATRRDAGWATLLSADGRVELGRGHLFVMGAHDLDQRLGSLGSNESSNEWRGALDPIKLSGSEQAAPGKYQLRPESPHQYSQARTDHERETAQELLVEVTEVQPLAAAGEYTLALRGVDGNVPEVLVELGGE